MRGTGKPAIACASCSGRPLKARNGPNTNAPIRIRNTNEVVFTVSSRMVVSVPPPSVRR